MESEKENAHVLDPALRLKLLSDVGSAVVVDNSVPAVRYLRSGPQMEKMARTYYAEGQLQTSFILYNKFATLFVEKLPKHPGYAKAPSTDRQRVKKLLKPAFERAMELKDKLKVKFEKEKENYLKLKQLEDEEKRQKQAEEEKARKKEEKAREEHKRLNPQLPSSASTVKSPTVKSNDAAPTVAYSDTPPVVTTPDKPHPTSDHNTSGEVPTSPVTTVDNVQDNPEDDSNWIDPPFDEALLLSNVQTFFDDEYEEDVSGGAPGVTATNENLAKVLPDGPTAKKPIQPLEIRSEITPPLLSTPPSQPPSQPQSHVSNQAQPHSYAPYGPAPIPNQIQPQSYVPVPNPNPVPPPQYAPQYSPQAPPPYSPYHTVYTPPIQAHPPHLWQDSRSSSFPRPEPVMTMSPTTPTAAYAPGYPSVDRSTKPVDDLMAQVITSLGGLEGGTRPVILPSDLSSKFLSLASSNTRKNVETCGIIGGKLVKNKFIVSHVIVPKQTGRADSCETLNEEEIFGVQDKYDLISLGWIHTHPSQTSFMSSVDLHTHYSYQIMLEEAIAIVCAPKYNQIGVFSLTQPHGLNYISKCSGKGFHTHPKEPPLYMDCTHVEYDGSTSAQIIDLR